MKKLGSKAKCFHACDCVRPLRRVAPLLLTGFARALGWSVALERWPDPVYLGPLLDGVPGRV